MKWIKTSEQLPPKDTKIIYFDGNCVFGAFVFQDGSIESDTYYCNSGKCNWIYDDCGCYIVVKENDHWMILPDPPLGIEPPKDLDKVD